jgi:predicted lipoprotein with Yx(FWY)xxD motif
MLTRTVLPALLALALLPAGAMAAKVGTADSRFGTLLVDGRGHTLYAVTKDGRGPSRCYGTCARAWPPFYAGAGKPTAIGGAKASFLGTTKRRGGRRQVTYRGRPLYFYIGEKQAGQILCQNVFEFGGFWRILRANGAMVTT